MDKQTRRAWGRWLRACGLPLPHVAAVLGCEIGIIEADARIDSTRIVNVPTSAPLPYSSPHRGSPSARAIIGKTAAKIRVLTGLGYDGRRVAEMLALDAAKVADFLARSRRLRGGDGLLDVPRDRADARAVSNARRRRQRRLRAQERRRAVRANQAACRRAELAQWHDVPGVGMHSLETQSPAFEFDGEVSVPAGPWRGPTSLQSEPSHIGRTKLTPRAVLEIRRLFAHGWTQQQLAQKFGTAQHNVFKIVTRRTWKHI